jgi:hypothetical protein
MSYVIPANTAHKGGIALSSIILGIFLLATATTGFIGVQSNLKNKCSTNTFGVKIATSNPSKYFLITMIVFGILMILAAFAGIGVHMGSS